MNTREHPAPTAEPCAHHGGRTRPAANNGPEVKTEAETATVRHDEFKAFVAENVEPFAGAWDREQRLPDAVLEQVAGRGYLGANVPAELGGQGWDMVTVGLLHEAMGKGSSSLTDILTIQLMVTAVLLKWGTAAQKRSWVPRLARGEVIAAFALTEAGAGTATQAMTTEWVVSSKGDSLLLNGGKKWISGAQLAGLFLVFGKVEGRPAACLVPRQTPGLRIEPITDLSGFRAAGLGELHFQNLEVPADHLVGKPGFGLSHIAAVGLHFGRISTACSALGLLRACLEASVRRAGNRWLGDRKVGDLGVIRSMLARMGTDRAAAALLCRDACRAEDEHRPEAFEMALRAKHFVSRAAVRAASDTVQIHGASGCHESSPVPRYHRDARIMEIIEGTTQMHEDLLGRLLLDQAGRLPPPARTAAP